MNQKKYGKWAFIVLYNIYNVSIFITGITFIVQNKTEVSIKNTKLLSNILLIFDVPTVLFDMYILWIYVKIINNFYNFFWVSKLSSGKKVLKFIIYGLIIPINITRQVSVILQTVKWSYFINGELTS